MSISLCDAFTKASLDTWYRIQEGRALRYPLGEETLTDLLLRDLLRLHLPDITIRAYTKDEEGRNGADWEWWFQGSTGYWIGLRVQAKVISHRADVFEHLHYYKNTRTTPPQREYQCDKLIAHAGADPAWPRVPLYCLYSYWTAPYSLSASYCCWGSSPTASAYGCSIVPAADVQALRAANAKGVTFRNSLAETLRCSLPLACLACCPFGPGTESIAERLHAVLALRGALQPNLNYLLPEPPFYVLQLAQELRGPGTAADSPTLDLPPALGGVVAIRQAPRKSPEREK